MTLETSVYSAFRGYGWSAVPKGLSVRRLNQLYRFVSATRGNFPNPTSVDIGLVSDGKTVAVFSVQNVRKWDAEKRACDYAALAFFPIEDAARIDFADLIKADFFWTPTHKPPSTIDYKGPVSEKAPLTARGDLQAKNAYLLTDLRAVGDLIAQYGPRSARWVCLLKDGNTLSIECNSWT